MIIIINSLQLPFRFYNELKVDMYFKLEHCAVNRYRNKTAVYRNKTAVTVKESATYRIDG